MRILDLESAEHGYNSLELICGVARPRIEALFNSVDINHFYGDKTHGFSSFDRYLFAFFQRELQQDLSYERTCWFHLTRAVEGATFSNGLLPLHHALDGIWQMLYELVSSEITPEQWVEFRRALMESELHSARLYRMKANDPRMCGPYAMLIKEFGFRPNEIGNHDYLRTPEIVEDICLVYRQLYGLDLLSRYINQTKPCIVKFHAPARGEELGIALCHLHNHHKKVEPFSSCNTCYVGEGVPVPGSDILSIEFPEYQIPEAGSN